MQSSMRLLVPDERVAIDHLMAMGDRENSTGVAGYFVEDAVRTSRCSFGLASRLHAVEHGAHFTPNRVVRLELAIFELLA